jgi:hypothetical protein
MLAQSASNWTVLACLMASIVPRPDVGFLGGSFEMWVGVLDEEGGGLRKKLSDAIAKDNDSKLCQMNQG